MPARGARAARAKGIAICAGGWCRVPGPHAPPTFLGHTCRRLEGRLGGQNAAMAVAHTMLVMGYPLLLEGTCEAEARDDRLPSRQEERPQTRAVKAVERRGSRVT